MNERLELTGLDGSNPLGFLAALGTLAELSREADLNCRMGWAFVGGVWNPHVLAQGLLKASEVVELLATRLCVGAISTAGGEALEQQLDAADAAQMDAKRAVKNAQDEIKSRKLRGKERDAAVLAEVEPLIAERNVRQANWLKLLEQASPSPELALGKDPAAPADHFQFTARRIVAQTLTAPAERGTADLIAAFGNEAVFDAKTNRVMPTPFCFVTGSGHQYFLQTVRDLLCHVDAARLRQALFEPRPHEDGLFSLRWDPVEDRRYSLMWADPTASGNKAKTNWALNLLAYRGLQLLPSMPAGRRLATTGFARRGGRLEWTWPVWTPPLDVDVVRSLLARRDLQDDEPNRRKLAAIGIAEIFRSVRIQVGNPPLHKLNFSPATAV